MARCRRWYAASSTDVVWSMESEQSRRKTVVDSRDVRDVSTLDMEETKGDLTLLEEYFASKVERIKQLIALRGASRRTFALDKETIAFGKSSSRFRRMSRRIATNSRRTRRKPSDPGRIRGAKRSTQRISKKTRGKPRALIEDLVPYPHPLGISRDDERLRSAIISHEHPSTDSSSRISAASQTQTKSLHNTVKVNN